MPADSEAERRGNCGEELTSFHIYPGSDLGVTEDQPQGQKRGTVLEEPEAPLKGKAAPVPICPLLWKMSVLQHCSEDCPRGEEAPGAPDLVEAPCAKSTAGCSHSTVVTIK